MEELNVVQIPVLGITLICDGPTENALLTSLITIVKNFHQEDW